MTEPLVRCDLTDGAESSPRERNALSAGAVDERNRRSGDPERAITALVIEGVDESVERPATASANLFEPTKALEGMTAFLERRTPARVR